MTDTDDIQWIHIPGFDNYRVNALGQIQSRRRSGSAGRILKPTINEKGYPQVTLYRTDGTKQCLKVHNVVALVFHGPRPDGLVTRHLDGDQLNNVPSNLVYGTVAENNADQVKHGVHAETRKTRCRNGHRLEGDNLMLRRDGKPTHRRCKRCHADNTARYRARRKARS